MEPLTSHHLLPHERWFVANTMERWRTHRSPYVVRMEDRLGAEGVTLYLAAQASYFPGYMTAMAGLVLVIASWSYRSLLDIGLWVMFGGCALAAGGWSRALQAGRARRAFHAAHPQDSGSIPP